MADTDYKGTDKIKHCAVCYLAAIVWLGLGIGLALGKEYGDYKNPSNHWCWWDLLADVIGCAIGSVVHYLLFGNIFSLLSF